VNASVTASDVIVAGRLEGRVQCEGRFLVLATGSVDATVATRTALFEPGSCFAGELRLYRDSEQPAISDDSFSRSRREPEKAATRERPTDVIPLDAQGQAATEAETSKNGAGHFETNPSYSLKPERVYGIAPQI
jgi:hypothetical protein